MGNAVGWLGTGDMHLNVGMRRKAFLNHYRQLLDQVNVFGLPHHGSHRNFHPSLPDEMPNLTQCVAAAGPNGYGHPHADVVDIVNSSGRQFIQADNTGQTALRWRHAV
jgi:beta-lactamase superfamily II metal-dependent hydrolase